MLSAPHIWTSDAARSNTSSTDRVEDHQQNYGTKQRDANRAQAEIAAHNVAATDIRIEQKASQKSTNDANHDVHYDAAAAANQHASNPTY